MNSIPMDSYPSEFWRIYNKAKEIEKQRLDQEFNCGFTEGYNQGKYGEEIDQEENNYQ